MRKSSLQPPADVHEQSDSVQRLRARTANRVTGGKVDVSREWPPFWISHSPSVTSMPVHCRDNQASLKRRGRPRFQVTHSWLGGARALAATAQR
jgi:hypothetical protein